MNATVPIFRSDAQFALLGELFTGGGVEMTIAELARRAGVSRPTASREVARLSESGLVITSPAPNRTTVAPAWDHPLARDLAALLAKTYGPPAAITPALADIEGITEAFIFGSWAARWHGVPGPPPGDIDVLILGEVDSDTIWSTAAELSRALGIDVNPTVRTLAEWAHDSSGFADTVKASPRFQLISRPAMQANG